MKSTLGEILETVILTVIIFVLVRSVVQNFKVEGRSMEPTLRSGQYLLVNKAAYWSFDATNVLQFLPSQSNRSEPPRRVFPFGEPQRGDIVVFMYPVDPSRDFIKRIIGLPGDQVAIKQGAVYVNGQQLVEPYLQTVPQYDLPEQIVPPGQYFVLGDNRNSSSDSHVWGMVPKDNIVGKALLCYWPPDEWGFLSSGAPAVAQSLR